MKSALIKRTDDRSRAPQRRRSSGNISTRREGRDEIGSRRRTDRGRARSNRASALVTITMTHCSSGWPFLAPNLDDVARGDLAVLADRRLVVGGAHRTHDFVVRYGALLRAARRLRDRDG